MNRNQRRAAATIHRWLNGKDFGRDEAIRLALSIVAHSGPTATGATLVLPNGETIYLSADDARAMADDAATGNRQ